MEESNKWSHQPSLPPVWANLAVHGVGRPVSQRLSLQIDLSPLVCNDCGKWNRDLQCTKHQELECINSKQSHCVLQANDKGAIRKKIKGRTLVINSHHSQRFTVSECYVFSLSVSRSLQCAQDLRHSSDAWQFSHYILGLVFISFRAVTITFLHVPEGRSFGWVEQIFCVAMKSRHQTSLRLLYQHLRELFTAIWGQNTFEHLETPMLNYGLVKHNSKPLPQKMQKYQLLA